MTTTRKFRVANYITALLFGMAIGDVVGPAAREALVKLTTPPSIIIGYYPMTSSGVAWSGSTSTSVGYTYAGW